METISLARLYILIGELYVKNALLEEALAKSAEARGVPEAAGAGPEKLAGLAAKARRKPDRG